MSGSAPLHVGVNLLWLVPGEVGGSEQYVTRLLTGVLERGRPDVRLTLFALPAFAPAHPELAAALPVVAAPVGGRARAARVAVEATWLVAQARRRGVDLLHHGGGTMPLTPSPPGALTIHDLQYLTYPATFNPAKLAFLRAVVPASVRRAAVVCTPSEWVRQTVVEAFAVDPGRVVAVPHGLPSADLAAAGRATPEAELRRRLRLDGPFVLLPAITYRHKNHATLLRALALVPGVTAVLTGGVGPAEGEVLELAAELGVADRVRRPGRVAERDLEALYLGALACTFPSRYEGFGAPVLEAMARGCPVVAADATALPEVVAGAGLLVDPDDPGAWAAALRRLLDDGGARADLAARGHRRAAAFSAERSASTLVEAWLRAAPARAAASSERAP